MIEGKREQRIVKTIIVLIRNTTWRCGKLERVIVKHLHKRKMGFGNPQTSMKDMLQHFKVAGKRRNEVLDAVRRLERRNIVRILTL